MTKRIAAARLDEVIDQLRQSLCDEVRDQFELLREEIADRDSQILKLLHELRSNDAGLPHAADMELDDDQRQYRQMIERLRTLVTGAVPSGATIAVASKGDPELLNFENRIGWHFPQWADGSYTGFHPKDSAAAIKELDHICGKGAKYLVFPATGSWWLEHYAEFARHLHDHFEIVARDDRTGVVFGLLESATRRAPVQQAQNGDDSHLARQVQALLGSILPPAAKVLVVSNGDPELTDIDGCEGLHFPQDTDGEYAGYHPADSQTAITHLEQLRRDGAQYLVFPKPSAWWLRHYVDFRRHLESRYRAIIRQRHVCTVFDLSGR
jgi:hypothetical protein